MMMVDVGALLSIPPPDPFGRLGFLVLLELLGSLYLLIHDMKPSW